MTDGLVQHITVEESISIQWVKVYGYTALFTATFPKGDNFCDFRTRDIWGNKTLLERKVYSTLKGSELEFLFVCVLKLVVGGLVWVKQSFETIFQLISAVSQREGVRKEREVIEERKKFQTTPIHSYCKHSRPLFYCYPNQ